MSRKIAQDFNSSFSKVNVADVLRKISSEIFVLEYVTEDCAIFQLTLFQQGKFSSRECRGRWRKISTQVSLK